ncbi:MAG: TAT-variant-translocated molybdopterin oxidoreductase [Cytophagaceae bacterium]|nr:TAT-variant-translocated molybdopterin oxidoreductase [Cytophagaceae bacterium]MDW8455616.1 TAT-variant-translocated molybdopterin oxidoreductase [Cytophagaceae bacterium]
MSKENTKIYWKGIEELSGDPDFLKNASNEFPEYVPLKEQQGDYISEGTSRRDFLKMLGFGLGAVTLAACEAPVKKAIPYLNKPEEIEPGIANYYASTYVDGGDFCSVLVKTREGRPIKIEGNSLCPISKGGTTARVQASVLSLYDSTRLQSFYKGKDKPLQPSEYDAFDTEIINALSLASNIRIVSQTILSPTTRAVIQKFKEKYTSTEHVVYDASSAYGILQANKLMFGKYVIPSYDFSKADVIVSFGADFLGTWISPVEYARQYVSTRRLGKSKKTMSKHYQFETNLSLTGSNADIRVPIKPSEEALYVATLYNAIAANKLNIEEKKNDVLKKVADLLNANKGRSIVVCGSNDVNVQLMINEINRALGNYGTTIDLNQPSYQRQGDDERMNKFIDEVKSKAVDAVIFYGANPVYDHPRGAELAEALKSVKVKISFNERMDETTSLCDYVAPDHHYLESWGDAMPKKGIYTLMQPTINPVYKSRSAQESLLKWAGINTDYYSFLSNYWKSSILNGASWEKSLHDGVFVKTSEPTNENNADKKDKNNQNNNDASDSTKTIESVDWSKVEEAIKVYKTSEWELKLYEKVGIGWGSQAANPWLQELPDPISKATWDNYIAVNMVDAQNRGWKQGDVKKLTANGASVTLPILIQPGQTRGTVSVAIGYGRVIDGKRKVIGENAFKLADTKGGYVSFNVTDVKIEDTGDFRQLAQTQTHHTIMSRPIIQDATFEDYLKNPSAGRFIPMITTPDGKKKPKEVSLWEKEHDKPNHLWQMSIDLNACIGCGACVISCQAENNVPVVGRDEVLRRREMHWIRIDRYYSSDADSKSKDPQEKYFNTNYNEMEIPAEYPQVTFMPMMCQHCNHAPCETVCPVAATTHSSEGLNQMAYNRCFGTRYCANNCPYKVRRFNWFKYFDNRERFPENIAMNTDMGRMVLNPDVTVRSRGVMEKCSMCVQRIQEGKLKAKKEKRPVKDGEIKTACMSACPTQCIIFGDINDKESAVYQEKRVENAERVYAVLEELNVQPNVEYLTKIRNI